MPGDGQSENLSRPVSEGHFKTWRKRDRRPRGTCRAVRTPDSSWKIICVLCVGYVVCVWVENICVCESVRALVCLYILCLYYPIARLRTAERLLTRLLFFSSSSSSSCLHFTSFLSLLRRLEETLLRCQPEPEPEPEPETFVIVVCHHPMPFASAQLFCA